MTATSLLDVVSLQSAASIPERLGLHSHLTSQPVVLIERLRGRNPARDLPAPRQTETSPPHHPKSTTKKTAEPPKLNIVRKKLECKRVHAMSLRSRRLSKLEKNKILAQSCAPSRRNRSKRKKTSSDEDEPLIFQKTRKTSPAAAAASEISTWEQSLKVKSSKGADERRKVTVKETKTTPVLSRNIKEDRSIKKKRVSKRIPKKPEITAKETLTSVGVSVNEAAFDNLVTLNNSVEAVDPVIVREDPVVAPVGPALVPDGKAVLSDDAIVRPVNLVVVPDSPLVGPVAPVGGPDAPVGSPDAPVQVPEASVVGPDGRVVVLYNTVASLPFSPIREDETPEQCAQIMARLDGALSHLDELPDLNNLSDCENDQIVRKEVQGEVPLNQRDTALEDRPSTASSNSPLVYRWTTSDDEPTATERCEAPAKQQCRSTIDSPAPGPSGVQNLIVKYNSETDQDDDDERNSELKSVIRKIMDKAAVQHAMSRMAQTSPLNCVAASWCTEQDVINASTEQLDSRCKVCKHCQKLEKVINAVALLKTKTTEAQVTMKVRAPVIYGKAILGVNCERSDEPSTSKQNLFQLEGKGNVLDKLIDTLNISEGSEVNSEIQNNNPVTRRLSMTSDSTGTSSDSNTEEEKTHQVCSERRKIKYQKVFATRRRLAEAKAKQDRIRQEKECDNRRIEQRKKDEIALEAQKKNCDVAEIARLTERFEEMQKEKAKEIARLKVQIRDKVRAELEADRRLCEEVDSMAQMLANEKDAKSMLPTPEDDDEPGTSELATEGGTLVDAPVYYPTLEEFEDPVTFFEKIYPETMKYGVCKVVSPPGWSPPSEVHGDIRFDVMNQYVSRLFSRWGPAARELSAIKLCLQQHTSVNFGRPPHLDGVEINLPKLYHLVQRLGGLESVINKNRWCKVADDLKMTKAGHYEKRLDHIYVKFLLAYDTLSHQERQETMRKVEMAWNKKNQKLLDRAMNPLYRQQRMLGLLESSDEETEDEKTKVALKHAEDCIIKGQIMQHSRFKKVASLAFENTFGPSAEGAAPPALEHIEEQYWRLVTSGTEHVCVHTAAIDTGAAGHGFTTSVPPYASHAWNPKRVINNPRNVLRYLGPVVGVTLPTLLLGMLFSTSCWHKDPHCVAWYEYQSKGPTRIWYGIPADQADNFRKAVETLSPTSCQNKALWLSSEIAMIPPSVLREHNVRLTRVTQNEGEFIMAFPNAYTSCISTGYTESESVYFASADWLDAMWNAFKVARESCEPTMFSIEQLLYNIARDKDAEPGLLKRALPLYDKMLREEITNRQMLQERGLSCVQVRSGPAEQQANSNNARPLEECDYCRASLFLSKVKGLPARNSVLCLEHTLALLDTERHRDADVRALALLVLVSVKELNRVHDDMRRRSAKPARP